jgi:peptidoglycan/xylan/chitin deacetylase (PgdA/CDA1 family)
MTLGKAAIKRLVMRLTGVVNSVEAGSPNSILFTFDDGPHPEVTPRILSLLDRHRVRGVFFVVGARIPRAPKLLRTILDAGHALGNHSFSHPNERPLPPLAFISDLRQCQSAIADQTGTEPRLFRPPLGRLSLGSVVASRFLGLKTLLWSVDTGDWQIRNPQVARARGIEVAADLSSRTTRQEILLMHDDNPCSIEVLEGILPVITSLGCDVSSPLDTLLR